MKGINELEGDCGQFYLAIKTLQNLPKDKTYKLLDVGAGGHYIELFLPENVKYYSLDYDGKQTYKHNLDTFPIPIKNKQFDIILCLETLEHTLYPHEVMKELLRIAKPDAIFLLSMPNEYNFYCRFNFLFERKTFVQEPFKVVEKHLHIQLPRERDIINFFSQYIDIEKIEYRWYSRTSGSKGAKGKIFLKIDKGINKFSKIIPSLFTRTVAIKGKRLSQ